MQAFDYLAPRSLSEVYEHLGNGKRSLLLAGGTDLIIQLREDRKECDQVIDLKHIPELTALRRAPDGTLEIGAATALADIYANADVRRLFPALVDAATIIGGTAIQSRASLGGNLCNASPAADSSPALIALRARLVIGSSSGTREIPVEDFFAGPGQNTLRPDEILLQVKVPPLGANAGAFYLRFIPRNEMDIAVASAGAWLQLNGAGDRIESGRIALGAVAATPVLAPAAAAALVGQSPTEETFARAGEAAKAAATPITDMRGSAAQRSHLVSILTVRALRGAHKRALEAR